MSDRQAVAAATGAAALAEVFWRDAGPAGPTIAAITAIPLLWDRTPTLALTYADEELAHRLAGANRIALVYSDPRASGPGWQPMLLHGRPTLTADPDGTLFTERLLDQELRKHPPSRALVDSVMLRREHWWYLPRLIITLQIDTVEPFARRTGGPTSALLARLDRDRPVLAPIEGDRLTALLTEPAADRGSEPGADEQGEPAMVFGHDFTPDLEQRLSWSAHGRLIEDRLLVRERVGGPVPATGLTLWQRLQQHRVLGRSCRRHLAG